jgi:hypothetical protein
VLGEGQGRGEARGATAENQDIEAVLRTHGVVFMVLRSLEPRAEYTPVGRAAHGNFPGQRGSSRGGTGNGAEAHGPNRFIAVRLR